MPPPATERIRARDLAAEVSWLGFALCCLVLLEEEEVAAAHQTTATQTTGGPIDGDPSVHSDQPRASG